MKKILAALIFSLTFTGISPAHAANEIRIVVTGPDADGITNIGYCFTDARSLSGTVSFVATSSYGSFLAHSEMPNCPSMVGSSTGQRLTEGTTYVFTVTATNGGNTFTDTLNYTAPAQPAPRSTPTPVVTSTVETPTAPTSASPETVTSVSPTPSPTPTVNSTSRIPYTQPCTGGSDRTPGLPQCLMPEGLGGSVWNLVDNNSGVVLNGAVCSEAVCGRNGEWRQWPADRKLNDRFWPTGYPEGATYIQTPFDGAYWGRYYTNGVYEVNGGGIVQPGSRTIVWPIQIPAPRTDTPTVTSETSTTIVAPIPSETSTASSPTPSSPAPTTAPVGSPETLTVSATTAPIAPVAAPEDDSALDEVIAEEEIIDSIEAVVQSNGTTRIQVSTGYNLTALTVVATKKGSKKRYTYKITTNADGERKFKSGLNLRGYTVVLYKGTTELDRMYIS